MARYQAVLSGAVLALLATLPAQAGPPQAPRPPQAPPVAVADAGRGNELARLEVGELFAVGADTALAAAPQAPAVRAKSCLCSPACVCGCNEGGVCQCAGSAVAAPASYWSCGPDGCRLVTGAPVSGCASCAGGSCGVAYSGAYGGSCGPGGCGVSAGPAFGGGRFFGGRGGFFRGFRGGRGGCSSCR